MQVQVSSEAAIYRKFLTLSHCEDGAKNLSEMIA
jgi:hypothetical protein